MAPPNTLWTDGIGRSSTRVLQFLIFCAGIALLIWALTAQALVTLPILIAVILACALQPVLKFFRVKGLRRTGSTVITFVGAILLLLGIFSLVTVSIYHQSGELVQKGVEGVARLQTWLAGFGINLDMNRLEQWEKSITSSSGTSNLGETALQGVATAGEILTGTLLTLVLLFFFLYDGDRMWSFIKRFIPVRHRREAHAAGMNSVKVLGAYVRGTMAIALFAAVVDTVVMLIMRAPLAIPLGVLIFFGAFVPILGALVTGLFATLITLVTLGPIPALILVVTVILVNQIEHHILQPRVMGHTLGIHGAVILVALAIGAHTGGISGAIVAVPVTAVLWSVVKTLIDGREALFPTEEQVAAHAVPDSDTDSDSPTGSHAAPIA
jgi:predicted PurR-regulated permease PerM